MTKLKTEKQLSLGLFLVVGDETPHLKTQERANNIQWNLEQHKDKIT